MLFIQHQSKKEQLFKMTNHLFLKGVRLEEAFGDGFVVVWQDLQTTEHPAAVLVRLKNDKIHATLNFKSSSA